MKYQKKLMTVILPLDGGDITIKDTEDSNAGTEAYNEFLRGGFIKYHDETNGDMLINASNLDGIKYSYETVEVEKGKDAFPNVDCDC